MKPNLATSISSLVGSILVCSFLFGTIVHAAPPVTQPYNGGTGTNIVPTLGQLLVGNGNGTYTLMATTSLGFGGSTVNYWTQSGTNIYNNNLGNIGISTTSPSDLLSVSGNAYFATNVGIGTNNPRGSLDVSAVGPTNFYLGNGAIGDNQIIILNGGRGTIGYDGAFQGTEVNGSSKPVEITTGGTLGTGQVAYFGTNGFVGLGSSTPYAQLSINPTTSLGIAPAISVGSSTGSIFGVSNIGNVTIPCTNAGAASSGDGYRFNGTVSGFSCLSSTDIRFAIAGANDPLRITNNQVFVTNALTVGSVSVAAPNTGLYVVGNTGLGTSTPTASLVSVAASTTAGTVQSPYKGVVSIIAGLENTTTMLFQEIDQWGHQITSGDTATVTGGTSSVSGNDSNGTITVVGTALTSVTLNFSHPWVTAPDCTESDNSTALTADITSISTSQVVFGFSIGINSGTVWYQCTGHQ